MLKEENTGRRKETKSVEINGEINATPLTAKKCIRILKAKTTEVIQKNEKVAYSVYNTCDYLSFSLLTCSFTTGKPAWNW